MKAKIAIRSATITAALSALLLVTGCPPPPPPPPPPTAVLEGTWSLTPTGANISSFLVSFDANGDITRVEYTYPASSGGVPVSVVITDPDFVSAQSNVNGTDVEITATWAGVNNFTFRGNLNSAETQIDGTITYFIEVGNVQVSLPPTTARLTRQ